MKHRVLTLSLTLLTLAVLLTACGGAPSAAGMPQDHMSPANNVPAASQQDRAAAADTSGGNGAGASALTLQQAVDIALDHAQVTQADTAYLDTEQEYDHGRLIYEVEFYVGQTEYKYEIDASTGEILDMEMEREHGH